MSRYFAFDSKRAAQMLDDGSKVLRRARGLGDADAEETLEVVAGFSAEELLDGATLRASAAQCLAASWVDGAKPRPVEREAEGWAHQVLWQVSSGQRPYYREPTQAEIWTHMVRAGVSTPQQCARLQGRRLVEVASAISPAAGCARLWDRTRATTLDQVRSIAEEGLADDPERELCGDDEENVEDVLERALEPGGMDHRSFPGPAFSQLGELGNLDRRIYPGESCVPSAVEAAASVIDGGGFAGGAVVDLRILKEWMQTEITAFAPSVTRAVRAELGGEVQADNGRLRLGAALQVTLVWLWSARHAPRTTE